MEQKKTLHIMLLARKAINDALLLEKEHTNPYANF